MEIYLDNSATTRCYPSAARRMYELMTEEYGNPSSLHQKGEEAEEEPGRTSQRNTAITPGALKEADRE